MKLYYVLCMSGFMVDVYTTVGENYDKVFDREIKCLREKYGNAIDEISVKEITHSNGYKIVLEKNRYNGFNICGQKGGKWRNINMIFKNRIKKEKLLADIESLNARVESLSDQVKEFYSTEKELRRILKNHAHGEVIGFSEKDKHWEWGQCCFSYKTYVYKNGEEYIFNDLYIENPNFSQGEKENIVYATSGDGTQKYVLDLFQNEAIEIEHRMNDNKNEPR